MLLIYIYNYKAIALYFIILKSAPYNAAEKFDLFWDFDGSHVESSVYVILLKLH